ncbi:MAG: hypothetical protein PHH77_06785 [Victivallaceae bacterium]|nr:hypothetical protein [Victivallaceae bacterium]
MGIASMVIGIVAAVLAFIPFCGYFAFIPAVIGLVFGIIDVVMKSKAQRPNGQGIAGIVLNAVAIVVIALWTLVFAAGTEVPQAETIKSVQQQPPAVGGK